MTSSADAIVIGAGLAGLIAARDLREAGYEVVLLEGRDRVGGRAWNRPMAGVGAPIELGGAWVNRAHQRFADAEMDRYGLRVAEDPMPPARFRWRFDGETSDVLPFDRSGIYEIERTFFRLIEAARRVETEVPRDLQDLADLDVSVREFLAAGALSPRAYDYFERFGALGAGAAADDWSALSAISLIAAFDCSPYAWFAGVVDKIAGGTKALVDALLEDGAPQLRLDTTVTEIVEDGDRVVVATGDGERLEAGAVVLATPIATWADIRIAPGLDGGKAEYAAAPHRGRMVKVWLLAEGIPRDVFCFGADEPLLFCAPQYDVDGAVLAVAFSSPPHLVGTDRDSVEESLRRYFPDARVLAVDSHDWTADRFSRGSWQVHRPGQLSRSHSALQAPHGRVSFAGSDTAVRWIGWFDGALESGARAAAQAAQQISGRDALTL
ncbi:MAG TPA: NAD(P)/FAD-dependent oxidoreductase [Solirubrobacterales bacterium]|jgi:monoamine oxidase